MDGITKSLLSEYYGFGSEGRSEKSLSSHTRTNSLEIQPDKVETTILEEDEKEAENTTKNNLHKGDENGANKFDARNLLNNEQERSSRVLSEDMLKKEDVKNENYETFFETNLIMNEYLFKNEKSEIKSDESSVTVDKSQLKPTEEISDSNLAILEESASEIRSSISSPMPKKRLSRKLKTSVMPLPPPPKKGPICNGVYLDLTSAGLSVFPLEMLDKLSNLRMLYLENNNLVELPHQLFPTLQFLSWLDVRNNRLVNLPSNIAHHPCLETILLQGNEIQRLPLELCHMPRLKGLQTMRNPLVFPPKEILAQGCTAILKHLREEWEKLHPEEVRQPDKELGEVKPDLTTILCYKPKAILKKKKIPNQLAEISSLSSTSSSDVNMSEKTVRQKSWDYRPSNRCRREGVSLTTAVRLMWIAKVKEMLNSQALALQRMKDKETLKDWRLDKSSYDKSLERASKRTTEDIPFAIDFDNIPLIFKQNLKTKFRKARDGKHGIPEDINRKIQELFESLSQLQLARKSQTLSPRAEQKLLETEIRKISDLQDEVQSLKRYNDIVVAPPMDKHNTPRKQIERPPSFII